MHSERPEIDHRLPRSALTNGKRLWLRGAGDGRSATGRRLRDLIRIYSEPFGGFDAADEHAKQLIKKAALLTVQSEIMEAKAAGGEEINPIRYATLANSLARHLRKLEKLREPKGAKPPTLSEALAQEGPWQDG